MRRPRSNTDHRSRSKASRAHRVFLRAERGSGSTTRRICPPPDLRDPPHSTAGPSQPSSRHLPKDLASLCSPETEPSGGFDPARFEHYCPRHYCPRPGSPGSRGPLNESRFKLRPNNKLPFPLARSTGISRGKQGNPEPVCFAQCGAAPKSVSIVVRVLLYSSGTYREMHERPKSVP